MQGVNVYFGNQLKNHRIIMSRLADKLGSKEKAKRHLNKCLYWTGLGSNDYINNYFAPQFYTSSKEYTPEQFAARLVEQYRCRVKVRFVEPKSSVHFVRCRYLFSNVANSEDFYCRHV